MPYKDPRMRNYLKRVNCRTRAHGNWGQIYIDATGMCEWADPDFGVCGSTEDLEFHHPGGEFPEWEGKERVLVCVTCHSLVHPNRTFRRKRPSQVKWDVEYELERDGGIVQWMSRYNLHYKGVTIELNPRAEAEQSPCLSS